MGTSGNFSRIFRTILGVSGPPATLRIDAPDSIRAAISVVSLTTVMMTGMSTAAETAIRFGLVMGALRMTPMAPWLSTSLARPTVRGPLVVPPPTPAKTGT